MPQNDFIIPWLTTLAQWLPPKNVAHIGANLPAIYQTLDAVPLWVVDFDSHKKVQVQQQFPAAPLHFLAQVVAEHTGPAVWHQASNAAESGLLPPEQLRHYWQNLKTIATQPVEASSLDSILTTQKIQPAWIWVDCFPALVILRGATNALAQANVVVARVIISDIDAPADTSLAAVQAFMQHRGFVLAGVQPERHPSIGTAVFFRDFAQLAVERQAELDAQLLKTSEIKEYQSKQAVAQQQQAQEASKTIAAIEAEKTQLETDKAALQTAHDALTAEKAQLTSERDAHAEARTQAIADRDLQTQLASKRQAQLAQLTQAQDAQSKLAAERHVQLEQATKTREEQTRVAAERQQQIEQLTKARDEQAKLASERQVQLAQLTQARDEQAKLAQTKQAEIDKLKISFQEGQTRASQLEDQLAEMEARQRMMNEEMIRAEGQIDLIKDVLLREPGL